MGRRNRCPTSYFAKTAGLEGIAPNAEGAQIIALLTWEGSNLQPTP